MSNISAITVSPKRGTIKKGEQFIVRAQVTPGNVGNVDIVWNSSAPSIASVDQTGKVKGCSSGVARISAYVNGSDCYDFMMMTVTDPAPAPDPISVSSINFNHNNQNVQRGESFELKATVLPKNASNKKLNWTSSNSKVATVSQSGDVTACGLGTARIKAMACDGSGKYAECNVEVVAPPVIHVECVEMAPPALTMYAGERFTPTTHICPENATDKRIIWMSNNPDVASIDKHTGLISAHKAGTAVITATTVDGGHQGQIAIHNYLDKVTIKSYEDVIIGSTTKNTEIIFNSSGKTWRCTQPIDEKNDTTNNPYVGKRVLFNTYQEVDDKYERILNSTIREYSDDELNLLYALDPVGVIEYVALYCSNKYELNREACIKFKDRVFKKFFKRDPKHYTRNIAYQWVETESTEYNYILSESELIFKIQQNVRDQFSLSEAKLQWVLFSKSMNFTMDEQTNTLCKRINGVNKVIPYAECLIKTFFMARVFLRTVFSDELDDNFKNDLYECMFKDVVESVVKETLNQAVNKLLENEVYLKIALDLVDIFKALNEFQDSTRIKNFHYAEITNFCANKTSYNIEVEQPNKIKYNMVDINRIIQNYIQNSTEE